MDLLGHSPGQVPERRFGRAFGGSLAAHAIVVALLIWGGFHAARIVEQPPSPINVVYLPQAGPGGGGGGNAAPPTPARLETPRVHPVEPVPVVQPAAIPAPQPQPALHASVTSLEDLLRSNGLGSLSLGTTGGGHGPAGIGPGLDDGIGPGSKGNVGGGPARPGNGCTNPVPLRQPRPSYTPDAMRAKIQGDVSIEAVIRQDGTVGTMRIVRSLDSTFGLDEEALKAAKTWLFRAATCQGQPADMLVTLVLEFRLH